ncbi:MAG TPA: sensor domain-containing diguanylate cyclase [Pyrinomonadaceae bacterium]|mgnify:CR=1 FL=1|nr:sensor domain-containing diguanylate cyclase [Pyrinomonadaceae bacterium]
MRTLVSDIQSERRDAMARYGILDSPAEREYDDLVLLASKICGVPVALFALIDGDRMWFKSKVGLDVSEIPRQGSFCSYALLRPDETLVVPDANEDARFVNNEYVTGDLGIRFYAGVPIRNRDRLVLGTLCVFDNKPHELSHDEQTALEAIARQLSLRLELRAALASLRTAKKDLKLREMSDEMTGLHNLDGFALLADQQLALARNERLAGQLWVMAVDIDGLKSINSNFGRDEGTSAIRTSAELIESCLANNDILARSGGDEFIVLLSSAEDETADGISQRIRSAFENYNSKSKKPYLLHISLGVVRVENDDNITIEQIIEHAFEAVSRTKQLSKGS